MNTILSQGSKRKRGRTVIGYGVNLSSFDRTRNAENSGFAITRLTRKIATGRLPELIQNRLITTIKTKNQREKFYSITPLGICHLFQNSIYSNDTITKSELEQIWNILERFSRTGKSNISNVKTESDKIIRFLKKFSEGEFKILIQDMVKTYYDGRLELILQISDDAFFRIATIQLYREEIILNESPASGKPEYIQLIEKDFHSYLANFIIFSLMFRSLYHDFNSYHEFKSYVFDKTKYLDSIIFRRFLKIYDKLSSQIQIAGEFQNHVKEVYSNRS